MLFYVWEFLRKKISKHTFRIRRVTQNDAFSHIVLFIRNNRKRILNCLAHARILSSLCILIFLLLLRGQNLLPLDTIIRNQGLYMLQSLLQSRNHLKHLVLASPPLSIKRDMSDMRKENSSIHGIKMAWAWLLAYACSKILCECFRKIWHQKTFIRV